jgi:hypothetical protein
MSHGHPGKLELLNLNSAIYIRTSASSNSLSDLTGFFSLSFCSYSKLLNIPQQRKQDTQKSINFSIRFYPNAQENYNKASLGAFWSLFHSCCNLNA